MSDTFSANADPGTGGVAACRPYVGRFAPSPTGPLHFGSLVTALASYLDARAAGGSWLVRMEDIDPPREVPGAADCILRQLEEHGLCWDGPVLYQSGRASAYAAVLAQLQESGLVYGCTCTRRRIKTLEGVYDGRCRQRHNPNKPGVAVRLRVASEARVEFVDRLQGRRIQHLGTEVGDFILRRRDGLFAYQLAVVVDDQFQGVTRIVRGNDLLDSTPRQIYLQRLLGADQPVYAHVPLVLNTDGRKLSKQNLAAGICTGSVTDNLWHASQWLGMSPPAALKFVATDAFLDWAVQSWRPEAQLPLTPRPAPAGY